MLNSIDIKKTATYDDAGIQIQDLKKVNFIYGANGSGKTTITKYLYNPIDTVYGSCELKWNNNTPIKTLVYNKDFRDRNFGKTSIDGVFTLGQATKEEIEKIEKKRAELKVLAEEGITKNNTLEKQNQAKEQLENKFREDVWVIAYKKYENVFKEAFKGFMQKETFKNNLINEFRNNTSTLSSFEELKKKSETIFGNMPENIALIESINYKELTQIEDDKIWQKKIVGKLDVDIAKLIQKFNMNDWVNEGRNYIEGQHSFRNFPRGCHKF